MTSKEESDSLNSYWQQQVEVWQSTDQSQKAFCQSRNLDYHRFGYWRRKFLEQSRKDNAQQATGFVPVSYHRQTTTSELSLSLPGGLVLQGIATDNLSLVYQLVRHLS